MTDTTTDTSAAAKVGPFAEKAKAFAREKPYATAALAGVLGLALLNTLRGKGRSAE